MHRRSALLRILGSCLVFHSFFTCLRAQNAKKLQTSATDGYGGRGSSIPAIADEGKHATVIVLHGLGGNGQEWAHLFLPVSLLSLTYVKFILPTAPRSYVTYMGVSLMSWFDIYKLDNNDNINRDDLFSSVARVNRIIEGEIANGVKEERIFLMGFSQGGAVALTAFLRSKRRLGGCMAVATWLPLVNEYPQSISQKIRDRKILMIHGTLDKVLPYHVTKAMAKAIAAWKIDIDFQTIVDGPHELFSKQVLILLEKFVLKEAPGPAKALSKMVNDLTNFFKSLSGR